MINWINSYVDAIASSVCWFIWNLFILLILSLTGRPFLLSGSRIPSAMGSNKAAVSSDLIDFTDVSSQHSKLYSTQSAEGSLLLSNEGLSIASDISSVANDVHDDQGRISPEQMKLDIEDYLRMPRIYSRERSPSNEEKPPPLPPKRRSQSRKNQKLSNRLFSAGIVADDDKLSKKDLSVKGKLGSSLPSLESLSGDLSRESTQDGGVSAVRQQVNEKQSFFQPIETSNRSKSSLSNIFLSNSTENVRNSVNFESRLKAAMRDKSTDLIGVNLSEFEISSKPKQALFPAKELQTPIKSSSWENLSCNTSQSTVVSLTVEDLESFISDVNQASASEVRVGSGSAQHGSNSNKSNSKFARTITLTPRSDPPKFFNRLSLPVDLNQTKDEENSKLYFGDGIFDLAEERNEEAKQFCVTIAELRRHYGYAKMDTNPGIVSDSITSWKVSHYPKDLSMQVYFNGIEEPINITFNVFSIVQDVVLKALLVFQDIYKDIDTISKNKYIFKVCGESCYLEGNERLINYAYVQNCLKLGEYICVIAMQRSSIHRDLARSEDDDDQEYEGIYFKHFFDVRTTTSISRQGLSLLIDTYNKEVEQLILNVSKLFNPTYVPEKLIQIVKALSLSLAYIESTQLHDAVNLLLSLKPNTRLSISSSQLPSGNLDFNRLISKDSFDRGRFNIALEKLTSAVFALVDAYCRAFDTNFNIHNPKEPRLDSPRVQIFSSDTVSSDTIDEQFSVRLCSVHRVPTDWKLKHDYFEVECGLFYGGQPICKQVRTKPCKMTIGFYEHITWDQLLTFVIDVNEIPRETKICFRLVGLTSPKKQARDAKSCSDLAWISINLFDFKSVMISGSHLFGLLSGSEMNPAATCASSYIQEATSVILRAEFQMYHAEVIFPEALIQTAQSFYDEPCPCEVSLKLDDILSRVSCMELSQNDKFLLWDNRIHMIGIPQALAYVLLSAPDLKPSTMNQAHALVHVWKPLSPILALGLMTSNFPDIVVRTSAVSWFSCVSESELCEYLPQLVQALKYETYHNSALSRFMITSALKSPKVAHYLFWHLKYYTGDAQFSQRFQVVLGALLGTCGTALKDQVSRQDLMVRQLAKTTQNVKETKDALRRHVLIKDLEIVATEINGSMRLPVNPSNDTKGIVIDSCSYYNSFTVPLSIVFENADQMGKPIKTMFKIGDDLRKDLVTLQLFRVMNRLWLSEGLDLKMITYECMPTAPLAGMVQLVPDAVTLREIHVQHGVTGSFKDDVIGLWLQKYNPSEGAYKDAVDNFTASCAAYCVATYVLGIGDRHNDNIMVTQKGHLFHIDFSKFMGNVQKFGTIRRDRVPFVLTPDMAFVINFGETMAYNFQHFIELCCDAFNIIRKNSDLILNLLGLMVSSGIAYLSTANDIEYVRNALQLQLSDAQATMFFTRLIETSLSSKSTQWNFFIHNMAHLKDAQSLSSNARAIFSFSNKVFSKETDGEVASARCVDIQKRYVPYKHYIFVLNVLRSDNMGPKFVFRKYDEFQELHAKLSHVFGSSSIPALPGRVLVGRSEIRDIAVKRRNELDEFLVGLLKNSYLSKSEILYTFLHSFIRDEQDSVKFADILLQHELGQPRNRVGGELKLSYQYSNGCLNLLVMHAKNLVPRTIQGSADPYVKSYLLPDNNKATKRKTRISRKNLNPTFNQTLSYSMPLDDLQKRALQVTVWDNDSMGVNGFLGGVNIYLATHDVTQERTQWYALKELGLGM